MKMDMEAYCWLSRIMGDLQYDMTFRSEETDNVSKEDYIHSLERYRNDIHALIQRTKITDDPEEL